MLGCAAHTHRSRYLCSVIIFLYLLDNDTSWMVLLSSGMGTVIEVWKMLKTVDVQVEWSNTYHIRGLPIRCPFIFSYADSYESSETRGAQPAAEHGLAAVR